jgi:hypothetical protein
VWRMSWLPVVGDGLAAHTERLRSEVLPASSCAARSGLARWYTALRAGNLPLGGIAVGELEAWAEPDTSSGEIGLGRIEVRDPVDENGPLTVQVLGEEQCESAVGEPNRRDPSCERFDGVHHRRPRLST